MSLSLEQLQQLERLVRSCILHEGRARMGNRYHEKLFEKTESEIYQLLTGKEYFWDAYPIIDPEGSKEEIARIDKTTRIVTHPTVISRTPEEMLQTVVPVTATPERKRLSPSLSFFD